jgi:hypothetical protein
MNKFRYLNLIEPAVKLVVRKGEDYNDKTSLHQYFPFKDKSYIQMIHLKALRLVSLADNPKPNFDSTLDTLYDLLNYTVFYLDYLENQACPSLSADTSSSSIPSSQPASPATPAQAPPYKFSAPQSPQTYVTASQSSPAENYTRKAYGENSPLS